MIGNILLCIIIFCALWYVWYFVSLQVSGSTFSLNKNISFVAVLSKEYEYDLLRSWAKMFYTVLEIILFLVIVGNLDFFSFSENPSLFLGYGGTQVKYEGLFYGVFVWEILSALEGIFFKDAGSENVLDQFKRAIFVLMFLFSFSFYYQTPFSDYVVLRQQAIIYSGIPNLGCVSHFLFFLLFFFYITYDLKQLNGSIIQHKIGMLRGLVRFAKIFILQLFLIYAFLGWTSQIPFTEIFIDRFPASRAIFEVISLLIKLIFVHISGLVMGNFLIDARSTYVRGLEKYLQFLSGINALLLIGIRLW